MKFSDSIRALLMPSAHSGILNAGVHLYCDSIMANGIGDALRAKGIPLLDFAQPGDTAANAWRRFGYDIRSLSTIVLEHGTNDLTGGNNPVPYLELMAKYAMAEGRLVIFTGITPRELPCGYSWLKANTDIRHLAAKLGCFHAHWDEIEYSSSDGLHPDSAMVERMAKQLHGFIG